MIKLQLIKLQLKPLQNEIIWGYIVFTNANDILDLLKKRMSDHAFNLPLKSLLKIKFHIKIKTEYLRNIIKMYGYTSCVFFSAIYIKGKKNKTFPVCFLGWHSPSQKGLNFYRKGKNDEIVFPESVPIHFKHSLNLEPSNLLARLLANATDER